MHYLTIVFIVWAVAATVLLALLAYRSTLTRYEEDCLFLGDCNDHQHKEQESILARVRKVQPAVRYHDSRHLHHVGSTGGHLYISAGPAVAGAACVTNPWFSARPLGNACGAEGSGSSWDLPRHCRWTGHR